MTFHAALLALPEEHRYRWCGVTACGRACACLGCANRTVLDAGRTYDDWREWVRQHPQARERLTLVKDRKTLIRERIATMRSEPAKLPPA